MSVWPKGIRGVVTNISRTCSFSLVRDLNRDEAVLALLSNAVSVGPHWSKALLSVCMDKTSEQYWAVLKRKQEDWFWMWQIFFGRKFSCLTFHLYCFVRIHVWCTNRRQIVDLPETRGWSFEEMEAHIPKLVVILSKIASPRITRRHRSDWPKARGGSFGSWIKSPIIKHYKLDSSGTKIGMKVSGKKSDLCK